MGRSKWIFFTSLSPLIVCGPSVAFQDSETRLHTQIEAWETSETREEWPPELRSEKETNPDPWAEVWSWRVMAVTVYTDRRQLFKGEIWSTCSSAKMMIWEKCYAISSQTQLPKGPVEQQACRAGGRCFLPRAVKPLTLLTLTPGAQDPPAELPLNDAWASWQQVGIQWTSRMFLLSGLRG